MRFILGFLVVAALAGGIYKHTRPAESVAPIVASTQVAKTLSSPAGVNSEHNWPKNSLDRAAEVKRQVLEQRKSDGY